MCLLKMGKSCFLSLASLLFFNSSFAQTTITKTANAYENSKSSISVKDAHKFNILFIAVDDLKPDLSCYGNTVTKTPSFEMLSKTATTFTSAYCQQAVCGPTRASLLTGLRPDKTQVWDLQTLIRSKNPDIVTLPQYFRANGYLTIGMGKVFDPRSVDKQSDELSWSVPYKKKFELAAGYEDLAFETYQSADIKAKSKAGAKMSGGDDSKSEVKVSTECLEVPDDAYMDGAMANYAVNELRALKSSSQPFFMAVGFKKPHLPFVAPKRYWDLYDREKLSLASWQQKSIDGPDIAYHNSGELASFNDILPEDEAGKKGGLLKLPEVKQRELIHGYYACISYIDAQLGKLLAALKENGLDNNTIVIIWGDHGWHLGDHSLWCKHSNFEQATRVPLMISVPGMTSGEKYGHLTEFVDIYPTLCELAGISTPSYLDGQSLVPALQDNRVKLKDFAISQYPRGAGKGLRETMGYTLRSEQYRYTEWVGNYFNTAKVFNEQDIKAKELYDLKNDPNETRNIVSDPKMKKVIEELAGYLHEHFDQQLKTAGVVK